MKLALILLAGCVEVGNTGTPWTDIAEITGELAPEQGPDPLPRDAPARLRIATFNVHFADDVDNLAAQIRASTYLATADVLFVQEIRRYHDEPISRAANLALQLGMTWVYAPAHTVDGGGVHGLAILSRFPLANAHVRGLPYFEQINAEQRIALRVDVMLPKPLRVVDVHLDTRLAPVDRIRQLDPAEQDHPDVIGGDLNTLPWVWVDDAVPLTSTAGVTGQNQAKIVDDYFAQNGYTRAVDDSVVTARAPIFDIRLDDLYARPLRVLAGDVEHVDGSDHWPVWFDLDYGSFASQ